MQEARHECVSYVVGPLKIADVLVISLPCGRPFKARFPVCGQSRKATNMASNTTPAFEPGPQMGCLRSSHKKPPKKPPLSLDAYVRPIFGLPSQVFAGTFSGLSGDFFGAAGSGHVLKFARFQDASYRKYVVFGLGSANLL